MRRSSGTRSRADAGSAGSVGFVSGVSSCHSPGLPRPGHRHADDALPLLVVRAAPGRLAGAALPGPPGPSGSPGGPWAPGAARSPPRGAGAPPGHRRDAAGAPPGRGRRVRRAERPRGGACARSRSLSCARCGSAGARADSAPRRQRVPAGKRRSNGPGPVTSRTGQIGPTRNFRRSKGPICPAVGPVRAGSTGWTAPTVPTASGSNRDVWGCRGARVTKGGQARHTAQRAG